MKDALATLGTILDQDQGRDAIHLAVMSVTAGAKLDRGERVRLDGEGLAVAAWDGPALGIVDPFLLVERVTPGQRFWLVLLPRTITSLRHVWTHPDVHEEPLNPVPTLLIDRELSRLWLEKFAQRLFSYEPYDGRKGGRSRLELLVEGAERGLFGTDIEYGEDCQPTPEFWAHFERYTGRKTTQRPEYFSCSC